MSNNDIKKPLRFEILYYNNIRPYEKHWRELMLDLGVPLETEWELGVSVTWSKEREDLPYDVHETVSLQDLSRWRSGEAIGETEVSDGDLELFDPVYVMRARIFLFDDMPTPETVPPVSPMFPDRPFLEYKYSRITPGSPLVALSFRFDKVPRDRWREEFLRHIQWSHAVHEIVTGRESEPATSKATRGAEYSEETARVVSLKAAVVLSRKATPPNKSNLARCLGVDRKTIAKWYARDKELEQAVWDAYHTARNGE